MAASIPDSCRRTVWTNSSASSYTSTPASNLTLAHRFHSSLPGFAQTPLVPLDELAAEIGVKRIFVKDESSRLGLPSFKILGASWGTFHAVADRVGLQPDTGFEELAAKARDVGIKLVAATDGNHGRAVARMARIMKLEANIYVPRVMDKPTEDFIASEGASVIKVYDDYDGAVAMAAENSFRIKNHVLVQDTSFEKYEVIPKWIVEGYSTLLVEAESQLRDRGLEATTVVTPVGVGSLADAVVRFAKSANRSMYVIAVEPVNAACLHVSLKAGDSKSILTTETIMAGMNCGTVSPMSWPLLKHGVDASVTVTECEAHQAVQYLQKHGINAGPCGAGAVAGLRRVAAERLDSVKLSRDSVVVLLSTEGARDYVTPEDEI